MARRFALIAALSLLSANAVFDTAWAQAESVSERPDGAAVVIYRDRPVDTVELMERSRNGGGGLDREGLALIVETRTVVLKSEAAGLAEHDARDPYSNARNGLYGPEVAGQFTHEE